jgi:malate synthase
MIEIRQAARSAYSDVYTPEAIEAMKALAPLDDDRHAVMASRIDRRRARAAARQRITFLDPNATIARTNIRVQDARDGKFVGSEIPQTCSGSGSREPARAPSRAAPIDKSIRNVAYALLSGADGWMFDGEDALGQVATMSLDNQRSLKLADPPRPVVHEGGRGSVARDEPVGERVLRRETISDWRSSSISRPRSSARAACTSTTVTFAARTAAASRRRSSTWRSMSSTTIRRLRDSGASIVLYLPKIQTAEEAACGTTS